MTSYKAWPGSQETRPPQLRGPAGPGVPSENWKSLGHRGIFTRQITKFLGIVKAFNLHFIKSKPDPHSTMGTYSVG